LIIQSLILDKISSRQSQVGAGAEIKAGGIQCPNVAALGVIDSGCRESEVGGTAVQGSVLNRFCKMRRADVVCLVKVSNSTRHFENTEKSPGR